MLSAEKLHQRTKFPLIGSIAVIQGLIERLSAQNATSTESKDISPNFLLIDTFANELVRAQVENPLDLEQQRRAQLQQTLRAQLEAALREHRRTPYHTDANEIDWDKFAAGQLKVFHRHYHQKDLRDHCREAVDKNTGAKRARYARELAQMDQLYAQFITPELENFNNLVPARASTLSWEVRQAYSISSDEEIYLGQKHALVMPSNLEVYPDGYSYINLHQLVYIPRLRKVLVTIDQYYAELSYQQHAATLNHWQPGSVPKAGLTEALLMRTITPLPEKTRLSPAFNIFLELTKTLAQKEKADLAVRHKQQDSLAFIASSAETLDHTSAFLTHILLLEYQVCQRHPAALTQLSQRLQVAFEMAAHPLLSGRSFAYQASLEAYTRQFLLKWLDKSPTQVKPDQLLSKLQSPDLIHRSRQAKLDIPMQQQRNNALLELSRTYPNILNSFMSQAQCAVGSVGGLTKMQNMLQSPVGARILGGHNASLAEIKQLIGGRAERWSRGRCVNPDCHMMHELTQQFGGAIPPDHLPFVGECSLCMQCELLHQLKEGADSRFNDANDLQKFGERTFANSAEAASVYNQLFGIEANLLPTFFLAERWVVN